MKSLLILLSCLCIAGISIAQNKTLGVGVATPNPNAALDVNSPTHNQGMLIPRLTTAERTAMTAALDTDDTGMLVFDVTANTLTVWNGTAWGIPLGGTSSNAGPALFGNTTGTGLAGSFQNTNAANTNPVLYSTTNGTGYSVVGSITNASNTSAAIGGTTNGTGVGLYGVTTGAGAGIQGYTTTGSTAIYGQHNGATYGNAGLFSITNATNAASSLQTNTIGTGSAGDFSINNTASAATALLTTTNGTGAGIRVNHSGSSGFAAHFVHTNTTTTSEVLRAVNNGLGSTARFNHTNLSNTAAAVDIFNGSMGAGVSVTMNNATNTLPAININHSGTGNAITANRPILATQFIGDGSLLTGLWGLTGNAGTIEGTNFIGTTDDVPLNFRVNNQKAGKISSGSVFIGFQAGDNSTGNMNTGIGAQTLLYNTTGEGNVAIGNGSLANNTTAINNTACGNASLGSNTIGVKNIAMGTAALGSTTTGNENTGIGFFALSANSTGSQNTAIGSEANVIGGNLTNATAIGYGATVSTSNKVRLGNTSVTSIEGQVAYTNASDKRLKTNIQNLSEGLDFVMKLKPVSYFMKNQEHPKLNWGFIAQDIEVLVGNQNSILTIGGDAEHTLGLRYTDFVAPLVKAIQEQQMMIENLKKENAKLSAEITASNEKQTQEVALLKKQMEKVMGRLGAEANKN